VGTVGDRQDPAGIRSQKFVVPFAPNRASDRNLPIHLTRQAKQFWLLHRLDQGPASLSRRSRQDDLRPDFDIDDSGLPHEKVQLPKSRAN
jgi:hypothetical protein